MRPPSDVLRQPSLPCRSWVSNGRTLTLHSDCNRQRSTTIGYRTMHYFRDPPLAATNSGVLSSWTSCAAGVPFPSLRSIYWPWMAGTCANSRSPTENYTPRDRAEGLVLFSLRAARAPARTRSLRSGVRAGSRRDRRYVERRALQPRSGAALVV